MIEIINYPIVELPKFEPSKSSRVESYLKKEYVKNNIRIKIYQNNSGKENDIDIYYKDVELIGWISEDRIIKLNDLLKMYDKLQDNRLIEIGLKIEYGYILMFYKDYCKFKGRKVKLQTSDLCDLMECLYNIQRADYYSN